MLEQDAIVGGRYVVQGRLGSGGMGEVYLGHDQKLDRPVALKVLRASQQTDERARARLIREARAAARLEHPGIVQVFDVCETEDGDAFLVMERIRGRSVRELIQDGPMVRAEALRITSELATALAAAHAEGVVHRDVKPDNAMVRDDGRIVLVDFGLVKRIAAPLTDSGTPNTPSLRALTRTGAIVGTPAYLAPEQARGRAVAATDQWALAVTAFELLSGQLPWVGQDTTHILAQIMVEEPRALSSLAQDIPPSANAVLERALQKDPSARYPDVQAFAVALLDAFGLEVPSVASSLVQTPGPPFTRRESSRNEIPNNLPHVATTFVGRAAEMRDLTRHFREGGTLVTVLGTGGTGKTRFACRYASTQLADYPGGAWFCDLADATSLAEVGTAVASALGVTLGREALPQLAAAIEGRGRVLIVLDNFEQIVELAAQTVGRWMREAPEARFLVTSRERLHVSGEQCLALPPLRIPIDSSKEELAGNEAVRLFVDRARAVAPDFELTESSGSAVAELVGMLDGLPLAIELAAARLRVLSPAKLVERLSKRFAVLRSSTRDGSARHSTLRGAIDWSWGLCTPAEQLALAQCSVFRGGFELEAAEATIDVSGFSDVPLAMDLVEALVDKSLLRSWPGAGDEEPRFGMYVSIQEYAAEKLREPGAVVSTVDATSRTGPDAALATEQRHAEHFGAYGSYDAIEALHGPGDVELRARLARAHRNVAVALERTADRGVPIVVPLARARVNGYHMSSLSETIDTVERALRVAGLSAAQRAELHMLRGWSLSRRTSHCDAGRNAYEQAVALAEQAGDRKLAARALIDGCHWTVLASNFEAALGVLSEARRMAEDIGDERYLAKADRNEGMALIALGRLSEARAVLERGLDRARRIGEREMLVACLHESAFIHQIDGRNEEARAQLEEAVALSREGGNRYNEGFSTAGLADHLQVMGFASEAKRLAQAAIAIQREIGFQHFLGVAQYALAMAHLQLGELDEAEAAIDEAIQCLEAGRDVNELCVGLGYRARIAFARGDETAARAALARGLGLIDEAALGEGARAVARLQEAQAILEGSATETSRAVDP